MTEYAVETQGLGKSYALYASPRRRILEWMTLGRVRGHSERWALRDIDLRVPRGAALGVCGANGSGKSTLLKLLSRTTSPSAGRFRTQGRVLSLLELGVGVDLDLSGRDNVLRQALILGHSRRAIGACIDEIVEFSELGAHIDDPVRTYSTGMAMRLGFSAAALMDPDVLILDEVLAVGDVAFQKKCTDRIRAIKSSGTTILFCSHSLYDLRQLCDEALWLRAGLCAGLGEVVDVTAACFNSLKAEGERAAALHAVPARDVPRVLSVELVDARGSVLAGETSCGDDVGVRVEFETPPGFDGGLHVAIGLRRQDDVLCLGVSTLAAGRAAASGSGAVTLRLPKLPLLAGQYLVDVWLLDQGGDCRYQEVVAARRLRVSDRTGAFGVFLPEHSWE